REYVVTPRCITWLRGCVSRRFVASESTRPGPTFPHPADKDVDLRVRQEASSALTESWHCSSRHALLNDATDRRIIGNREVNGTAYCHAQRSLSIDAMAPGAVLAVQHAEISNFARPNDGCLRRPPARRSTGRKPRHKNQRTILHRFSSR